MTEKNLIKTLKAIRRFERPGSAFLGLISVILLVILAKTWLPRWRTQTPVAFPQEQAQPLRRLAILPDSPILSELPVEYEVKAGDSSWKIAQAVYGSPYNYSDIETANALQPDQDLESGQVLVLPAVQIRSGENAATGSAKAKFRTHNTTSTDTLWKLAQKYYRDGKKWSVIYSANKRIIKNPDRLESGLQLVIPL